MWTKRYIHQWLWNRIFLLLLTEASIEEHLGQLILRLEDFHSSLILRKAFPRDLPPPTEVEGLHQEERIFGQVL